MPPRRACRPCQAASASPATLRRGAAFGKVSRNFAYIELLHAFMTLTCLVRPYLADLHAAINAACPAASRARFGDMAAFGWDQSPSPDGFKGITYRDYHAYSRIRIHERNSLTGMTEHRQPAPSFRSARDGDYGATFRSASRRDWALNRWGSGHDRWQPGHSRRERRAVVIVGVVAVWRVPTSRWVLRRRSCGPGGRR